jgi:hypothetical protein
MMLFGSLAYGQKKMTVEQTLMNIEQEFADAVVKNDMSVFEKYVADNGTFTDPGGTVMNKAQTIAMFKSGELKIESSKIDDMKVKVFGKTVIVSYRTTDKGTFKGRDISGQVRWTETFIKMDGKWMMVASQGTPVMQQ